jgi:hypothetical protein
MAVLGKLIREGVKIGARLKNFDKPKPFKWQRNVLETLLEDAKNTEFGRKYHFKKVLKIINKKKSADFYDLYKHLIPVYDYQKMETEWWHRTRKGLPDITWPGKIKNFALSSGTSDAATKYIPVSDDMVKAIRKSGVNQILTLGNYFDITPEILEKSYLMVGGSTTLKQVDDHLEGDLSGITQKNMPIWFQRFYKPGAEIAKETDWEAKLEMIAQNASKWDVAFLAGVPAWIQILIEKILEKHQVKTIHEIWPNLKAYAWGGVSLEPYREGFQRLFGKPVHYIETYLASEGFLGIQVRPGGNLQLILNNGIFFEFVPFTSENFDEDGNIGEQAQTFMIHEVNEHTEYALLISTCSGAWRYLIGDTIRFTNLKLAEFKITGRTKHFLSLCGEHTSVDNLNEAVKQAATHFNIAIKEFTVLGKRNENGLFGHKWYIGTDDDVPPEELKAVIDQTLCKINDDYAIERNYALESIELEILPAATFLQWMKSKGKIGSQHKFPRVLKGNNLESWEQFLANQHISKNE